MGREKEDIEVGFPDFWPKAQSKFPLFFEAVLEMNAIQNQIFGRPVSEPLHKVMRHISKIVSNSFGALVILVLNGYGNDAMRIARSMFEGAVISGYLKLHPEKVDDYLDWHWVRQKSIYEYMRKYRPEGLQQLDPESVQEMERRFEAVKPRYSDKKGRLRKSWTAKPLRQMAEEVSMGQLYLTYYSFASSMHHLDFGGLSMQTERQAADVDVAPSEAWLDLASIMGHSAALRCLTNYNEVASLGMDRELEVAGENFKRAWGKKQHAGD